MSKWITEEKTWKERETVHRHGNKNRKDGSCIWITPYHKSMDQNKKL